MQSDVNIGLISILSILMLLTSIPNVINSLPTSPEIRIGAKAGDWIRLNYTITSSNAGPVPTWMKVEILDVDTVNTTVTLRMTMHMSDETELTQTGTLNLAANTVSETVIFSGIIIPANCGIGDVIYIIGYGNLTIAGENKGTYVEATRSVVYSNFSQQANNMTFYWDKQTGILVEVHITSESTNATGKATETNMWQPELFGVPVDQAIFYTAIAVIAVLIAISSFALRKRKKTLTQTPSDNVAPTAKTIIEKAAVVPITMTKYGRCEDPES
jgi:hypothetical protein